LHRSQGGQANVKGWQTLHANAKQLRERNDSSVVQRIFASFVYIITLQRVTTWQRETLQSIIRDSSFLMVLKRFQQNAIAVSKRCCTVLFTLFILHR
jgi:hypothetical protein